MTGPRVGRESSIKFLATADLGHAQTDGSTEIDYAQARDVLNTTPEGTLQYVSLHLFHPQLCMGMQPNNYGYLASPLKISLGHDQEACCEHDILP